MRRREGPITCLAKHSNPDRHRGMSRETIMAERLTRDWNVRLADFINAGLIQEIPTSWQLLQGQAEMAPFVVMPDEGDNARYAGAPMSHPLLRTPLVFGHIGLEHLRVGHGLHSSPLALFKHLNIVQHEGMPVYDLQLVQTVPNGLERLREYTQAIEDAVTPARKAQSKLIDLVIPNAADYRRKFLQPGGWIDRAAAFDYDPVPGILRPEFATLVNFVNYCLVTFPANPEEMGPVEKVTHMAKLFSTRFRAAA